MILKLKLNLTELEEVVSVYKTGPGKYTQHTTRSWEFVGLEEREKPTATNDFDIKDDVLIKARYGEQVIVGVIDSGKQASKQHNYKTTWTLFVLCFVMLCFLCHVNVIFLIIFVFLWLW